MLKVVFLTLTGLLSYVGSAQSISKQIVGSAGTTQSNSNLKITYTVGEPVVGLMTSEPNQIGNGYHPSLNLQALSSVDDELGIELLVYPNPTSNTLFLSHAEVDQFNISVVDSNGKELFRGIINSGEALDFSTYSEGIYIMTINSIPGMKVSQFKIIKK